MSIETMKWMLWVVESAEHFEGKKELAESLRQTIEQAENQEPVAWIVDGEIKVRLDMAGKLYYSETNVYATPPKREWHGLGINQRIRIADRFHIGLDAVETIEAKLKERNT